MGQKLSLREKLAYGCGDLGSQCAFNMISTYLLIFLTDVAGLAPMAAGTVMLVAIVFDAINDPIIGSIADRSKRRKTGHYRPFMVAAAVPYGIFLVLCFITPDGSYATKLIWAYAVYLIFTIFSTCFQVPYGSMVNVMTQDPQQRILLGTFRDWGANLSGFLLNLVAVGIITKFSADGASMDARGFMALAVIFGVATAVFGLIAFANIKERYQPERSNTKIGEALKSIPKNKPALCLIGMVLFIIFFVMFKGAFTPYYAIYYLGNPDMIALILTTMFTLPLIGLPFVPKLNVVLGSRKLFFISSLCAILCGVFSLIAHTNTLLVVVSAVFAGLTVAGIFANIWGNMPNAADYGEWKTGVRIPGLLYGLSTFSIKLGTAFATYGASWVLALSGYEASVEVQTETTMNAIYLSNGIVPIVCGIIAILIIRNYKLDAETMSKIHKELGEKREAEGSVASSENHTP
jgi:GPH family glycoside/pentoside/hexuronide:cation symporter